MNAVSNAGHLGIVLIGVGFPLYLLFKGKLPAYLKLAGGSATGPQQALASPGALGTGFGQPTIAPGTTPQLPQGGTVGTLPGSDLGLF